MPRGIPSRHATLIFQATGNIGDYNVNVRGRGDWSRKTRISIKNTPDTAVRNKQDFERESARLKTVTIKKRYSRIAHAIWCRFRGEDPNPKGTGHPLRVAEGFIELEI